MSLSIRYIARTPVGKNKKKVQCSENTTITLEGSFELFLLRKPNLNEIKYDQDDMQLWQTQQVEERYRQKALE